MAGASAWTSSVWGGAKTALLTNGNARLREGEEECMICRGDVPASVGFQPCEHKVCFACVENMRAKNIFKADKGVRCPFCRTFIEAYVPLSASIPDALQEVLDEANKAAGIAAAARDPDRPSPSQPAAAAGPSNSAVDKENWSCGQCANVNLYWRDTCNRCGKPNPRPKPVPKAKDIMKCSCEELVCFVNEKLHPHVNKAFLEAGCPFVQGKITGTQEQVIAALKNKGEERLLRLVKLLADSGQLPNCSEHFFGNYTVQDLLEATAKLRAATQASYQFVFDAFKATTGGLDPFGLVHQALLPEAIRLATHAQGTYVLQKVVELGSASEMVGIAGELFKKGPIITADSRGVHVMVKLVTQLSAQYSVQPSSSIKDVMELLCAEFLAHPPNLKFVTHHQYGGKVVWEAVQVAIPRAAAVKLGQKLANMSRELASNKGGAVCVCNLLHLQALEPGCDEVLREQVCMVAMSLQGHLITFMMQEDGKGCDLVQLLVMRLAEEQEISWIDAIIMELVASGETLIHNDSAVEVLKYALSVSVFDMESARMHLDHLEQLLGDCSDIADEVFRRLQANPPPPPPKYYAPCPLQPATIKPHQPPPAPKNAGRGRGAAARGGHDGAQRGRHGRHGRHANGTARGHPQQQQHAQHAADRHPPQQQPAPEHSFGSLPESSAASEFSTHEPPPPLPQHAQLQQAHSPEAALYPEGSYGSDADSNQQPAFAYGSFPPPAPARAAAPLPPPQQQQPMRPPFPPQSYGLPPPQVYPAAMAAYPPQPYMPRPAYLPPGMQPSGAMQPMSGPPRGYAPHMQMAMPQPPYMPHFYPPPMDNGGGWMAAMPNGAMPMPYPPGPRSMPFPPQPYHGGHGGPGGNVMVVTPAAGGHPAPPPRGPPAVPQQMQPRSAAQPPARPAAPAPAPAGPLQAGAKVSNEPWVCRVCTYHHKASEANFLACAVCGSVKGVDHYS